MFKTFYVKCNSGDKSRTRGKEMAPAVEFAINQLSKAYSRFNEEFFRMIGRRFDWKS